MFVLGTVSKKNLSGVHPDLVKIVEKAIKLSEVDFRVTEGIRSRQRQIELVKKGASQTLASRHITGHAVDVVALIEGQIRWDWPLYDKIAKAFKQASKELNIPIVWGGDWKSFKDGPHFELDRKKYP